LAASLHFGLTAEKLFEPHESLPWNPLIARVFHRRGIIESWGRGTLKMAELTEKAGLPRPEIEEAAGCVVVRFRPSRYIPPRQVKQDLTRRQRRILRVLSQKRHAAVRDIAARLEMEARPIRDDLALMKQLGLVDNQGHGRGAVWFLLEAGIAS
jgi:ATP-dependent DNA helicase RecG